VPSAPSISAKTEKTMSDQKNMSTKNEEVNTYLLLVILDEAKIILGEKLGDPSSLKIIKLFLTRNL